MQMKVDFVLLLGGHMPTKGTPDSAGWDLYANTKGKTIIVQPMETVMVGTGIKVQPPKGTVGRLYGRSGLSSKGLVLCTGVSVIDCDYMGEIFCCFRNIGDETQYIYNGERIAQIIFDYVPEVEWNEVTELAKTQRGDGGFGSTGQ